MIISGGVNIYPPRSGGDVRPPNVLDTAVFGIPDDEWEARARSCNRSRAGKSISTSCAFVVAAARYKQPRLRNPRRVAAHGLGQAPEACSSDEHWLGRDPGGVMIRLPPP
jgi:hypothetical protein